MAATIWTRDFWKGAGERALKTFFQTGISVAIIDVGADTVGVSAGILAVSWLDVLSVAALAAVLSLGTSIGNADFTAGAPTEPPYHPQPGDDANDVDEDEADRDLEVELVDEEEYEPEHAGTTT